MKKIIDKFIVKTDINTLAYLMIIFFLILITLIVFIWSEWSDEVLDNVPLGVMEQELKGEIIIEEIKVSRIHPSEEELPEWGLEKEFNDSKIISVLYDEIIFFLDIVRNPFRPDSTRYKQTVTHFVIKDVFSNCDKPAYFNALTISDALNRGYFHYYSSDDNIKYEYE